MTAKANMPNCPECNFPYEEGQKFCNTCGAKLPVKVNQKICPVCGNTLFDKTKVCNICGTPVSVPEDTTAAEELARQQEMLKNPTMDAVDVPVITDDMLGLTDEQPNKADMPTMDSIFMPGQTTAKPKPKPKPVPIAKPAPAPVPQPSISPQQTPQMQNNFQQLNQQSAQPRNFSSGVRQQNNFAQPAQQYQQPQSVIPQQPAQNFGQPAMQQNAYPQNNMPQNNMPQNGQQNNAKPVKGGKSIAPLILIIAIIAVILVDVFVVFKKQIFGDKNDSKSKKNASVITVIDDLDQF